MKRVVWFTMGAAAGVAGTTWTQQKVKHAAAAAKPRAREWPPARSPRGSVDAVREGRLAMRPAGSRAPRASSTAPTEIAEVVEVQSTPTRRTRRVVRVRIPRR